MCIIDISNINDISEIICGLIKPAQIIDIISIMCKIDISDINDISDIIFGLIKPV